MGLENPKYAAEAVRLNRDLTDDQKKRMHDYCVSQMRGNCTQYKNTSDRPHAATRMYTSRGIKRMMSRVDKPNTPRTRNRRPRNGFAD